jgi:D-threo-aldose 1-dehydrogenase
MPTIVFLAGTDIQTSVIGFGCAGLFRQPSRARRRQLLETALDAGIRHFDSAPMYGLGVADSELGRFARGRRDRIVIATKFGISPTPFARVLARVQGPVRRVLSAAPALRERARAAAPGPAAGPAGGTLYRATGYDARAARGSLERSLRELRTDYIDVLLLHDPVPGDVRSDDIRGYLEDARTTGLIRAWGVAGEPTPTVEVVRRLGPRVPVLQVRNDILLRSTTHAECDQAQARIVFGVIGQALDRIVAHVGSDEARRRRWSDAVGANCGRAEEVASLLLRDALAENQGQPVLFSTVRPERIHSAVKAATTAPDAGLEAFRSLVAGELRTMERG